MKFTGIICLLITFMLLAFSVVPAQDFIKEGPCSLLTLQDSHIIYTVLSFNTGTVRDPEGKEGLNYVTKTLMEENIKKELYEKAVTSGAEFFTVTDKEVTTFFFKVHKDKFEEAYPVFMSGIISPPINSDTVDLAVHKALNKREEVLNHSESLSLTMLELFIYRNHPYGTPYYGTEASLKTITTEDVENFYKKYYTKENYTLGAGAENPEEIKEKVSKDLSSLPEGKPEELIIGEPEKGDGKRVLIIKKDTSTTAVALGFSVDFTRRDNDYYHLLLANSGLGAHRYMHGNLFRELRDIRGFNYGDYSYIEKFWESDQDKMPQARIPRQTQYFYIWIRNLADENACFAARFSIFSLRKMIEKGFSPEQFALMKDFTYYNPRLWAYNPFQKLGFAMDSDFYGIPYFIDYIEKNVENMTEDEVSCALKRRMENKDIKMVFVTDDVEKIKKQLLGEIDCRPVYTTLLSEEEQKEDEMVMEYDLGLKAEDIEIVDAEELF